MHHTWYILYLTYYSTELQALRTHIFLMYSIKTHIFDQLIYEFMSDKLLTLTWLPSSALFILRA